MSLAPDEWLDGLEAHGDASLALRCGEVALSWAGLAAKSRACVDALDAVGVRAGDLLAVLASPSTEGVALIHASLAAGVPMLPLNARQSESEQIFALESSRARFLVVDTADDRAHRLAAASGCGLLVLGVEHGPALDRAPDASRAADFDAAAARRRTEGAALVLRTSGTSGRPKGAVLTRENLIGSADGAAALLGSASSDRWLLCMPLFHIGGLAILIRAARVGASVVMHDRFEAAAVARALDEDGITRVSFVATMLERVIGERGDRRAPPGLELVLLGGGPASDALLERADRLGYPVAPTYGLTEAASQVATRPPGVASEERAGGLRALGGVSLRIVGDDGRTLLTGEAGEIQVHGPIVMHGYLEDPDATRETLRDGWLATGDIGRLDAEGGLRVLDRRTDLIVSGGENVYPAQIESVLEAHPDVLEAGVRGVDDATFGARPAAWVVLRPGASLDAAALAAFCSERLARYAVPVTIRAVDVLPRNATGKLLRRALPESSDDQSAASELASSD